MAGAGIEGAPAGGMIVAQRDNRWLGRGSSGLRVGGEGNNSRKVGGGRGCKCYVETTGGGGSNSSRAGGREASRTGEGMGEPGPVEAAAMAGGGWQ